MNFSDLLKQVRECKTKVLSLAVDRATLIGLLFTCDIKFSVFEFQFITGHLEFQHFEPGVIALKKWA